MCKDLAATQANGCRVPGIEGRSNNQRSESAKFSVKKIFQAGKFVGVPCNRVAPGIPAPPPRG